MVVAVVTMNSFPSRYNEILSSPGSSMHVCSVCCEGDDDVQGGLKVCFESVTKLMTLIEILEIIFKDTLPEI